jgi:hypothetical protein
MSGQKQHSILKMASYLEYSVLTLKVLQTSGLKLKLLRKYFITSPLSPYIEECIGTRIITLCQLDHKKRKDEHKATQQQTESGERRP